MNFPKRKMNRLVGYSYNTPNAYFITVCSKNRKNIFWENSQNITDVKNIVLSHKGEVVLKAISEIPNLYQHTTVKFFTIMPNHIHLLLQIDTAENGRPMTAPTVSNVINQMKGKVTKTTGETIWQKGFYDHIVRNEKEYADIREYIKINPVKWIDDELYSQE